MIKRVDVKKLNEVLVYAVVVEFLLYAHIWSNLVNISGIPYLISYWGFVCLGLLKVCLQKNTWKEWAIILLGGILAVCSWRGSLDKTPLLLMLGLAISKDVEPEKLIRVDLVARVLISIILIAAPLFGLAENHVNLWQGGRYRTYFGWEAPNVMGFMFLAICMEWMYLKHRKFAWYDYVGMLAVLLFLDRTANSRFSEALILGIIIVELMTAAMQKWNFPIQEWRLWLTGCVGALVCAVVCPVTGVLLYFFKCDFFLNLTGTFWARFIIPGRFLEAHGFTLFGSPYDPEVYDYLDMSFAYLGLHLGLLAAIVVFVILILAIVYGYRTKDERYLLFLMFILARSVLESEHFTLVYSLLSVFLGISLWSSKRKKV